MIKSYIDWLSETHLISEKLITFGGKAYPKFGNVVILAGGAGSGKDFQLFNLLGIEGKIFDVDRLKKLALSAPKILKEIKERLGVDDNTDIDLSVPENVRKLHDIIGTVMRLPQRRDKAFMQTMQLSKEILFSKNNRKPNLIFNVTLDRMGKLWELGMYAMDMGYNIKDIHIVWVVNDIEMAKAQNLIPERDRVVPEEILINTHSGAATTLSEILNMGDSLGKKYMDGDIWFSFNKKGADTKIKTSDMGGSYIADANYFKVKERGKSQKSISELDDKIKNLIISYIPTSAKHNWI